MRRFWIVLVLVGCSGRKVTYQHQHLTEDIHVRSYVVCKTCVLHLDGHRLDAEFLILDGRIVP